MSSVSAYIVSLLTDNPSLSNEEVADKVKDKFPGAKTTAASVSSVKSNAKKAGLLDAAILEAAQGTGVELDDEAVPVDSDEPEESIVERLTKRFGALDRMTNGILKGVLPALIVSGPPGLGKSHGLEVATEAKAKEDETFTFDHIKGSISAVGLYIALWEQRDGGVVILDDCDDAFRDETTLNLLKGALDSADKRILSWRKQANWLEERGIDDRFEFKGQIVFLTNVDFEGIVKRGKPGSEHFKALMDRSLYLQLGMKNLKDYMVRIKMIVNGTPMLDKYKLDETQKADLMEYIETNKTRFYHLSLRLVHQIALTMANDPTNWRDDIEMTKMRNEH